MDRSDVEFTVSLNTSPAEQQLYSLGEKMKSTAHIYSDVFRDVGQGFRTVGTPYQNSNNYNVPSTQVLERSLAMVGNSMEKFARIVEQISVRMVNFQTIGSSYTNTPNTIYSSNRIAGYLPSSTSSNVRPWFPTEHYTRSQVDAINDPNKVFNYLVNRRKEAKPFSDTYDIFNQIHSPMGAMGMYAIWNNLFGNKPPLGIEAPRSPWTAPKNKWTGTDGINTPVEQGKDIVDQEKKDNDELKEKLLLWSKIGATIYAIRKVLSGLAKVWKFGADTVAGTNQNINEEHGFFSIDPEGALRANSDKTRAMYYAGIRNMGENSPVSKEGFDYASRKISDMWETAVSGRNVDARTAIDAQRLRDFFGIDVTVAGLLTGEREGKTATDIQIDMMDKVEKQISKLAEADEITKGQVIDSLRNILGDELVDAIVANANKNLKIEASDLKLTVSEKLIQHGGSAIPSGNLTEATESAVKSISDLKNATDELKKTLLQQLSPAFVSVTGVITKLTNWLTRFFNDRVLDEYETETGSVAISSMNEINDIQIPFNSKKLKKQLKENADIKYENNKQRVAELLRTKDPIDALNALFFSQPDLTDASVLEKMGMAQQETTVAKALFGGKDEWENSDNPIIKRLKNYSYNGKKGQAAFLEMMKYGMSPSAPGYSAIEGNGTVEDKIMAFRWLADNVSEIEKAFSEEFGKNGKFDVTKSTMPVQYLYSAMMLGDAETQIKAIKQLAKESAKVLDNTVNITDVQHVDKNKNGRIDAGEVVFTVVVKDQYNNETRKTITADLQ